MGMEKDDGREYPGYCFGCYDKDAKECMKCDIADECAVKDDSAGEARHDEMASGMGYPGWCLGHYDAEAGECHECDMKDECRLAAKKQETANDNAG